MTVNHWVAGSSPARGANNVDSSSIGRAPDCGSGGCEFDSRLSTQRSHRSVRPRTLDCQSSNMGSNPIGTAI